MQEQRVSGITHIRLYDSPLADFKEPEQTGGLTVGYILSDEGKTIEAALALCSIDDVFNRKRGAAIVKGRLAAKRENGMYAKLSVEDMLVSVREHTSGETTFLADPEIKTAGDGSLFIDEKQFNIGLAIALMAEMSDTLYPILPRAATRDGLGVAVTMLPVDDTYRPGLIVVDLKDAGDDSED